MPGTQCISLYYRLSITSIKLYINAQTKLIEYLIWWSWLLFILVYLFCFALKSKTYMYICRHVNIPTCVLCLCCLERLNAQRWVRIWCSLTDLDSNPTRTSCIFPTGALSAFPNAFVLKHTNANLEWVHTPESEQKMSITAISIRLLTYLKPPTVQVSYLANCPQANISGFK